MRARVVAVLLGVAFGFALSWTHITSPDAIRRMLLLEDLYLYGVLGTSTGLAFVLIRVLRRGRVRALVTREPISWTTVRPQRHHVVGSAIFGVGWGIANTCPGPVAAQLGQGAFWSLLTIAGIFAGMRLQERAPDAPESRRALRRRATRPRRGVEEPAAIRRQLHARR